MITKKNFSNKIDATTETEFVECNFAQTNPVASGDTYSGVQIFTDGIPRTFTRCMLVNCDVPAGSTLIGCNTTISRRDVVIRTEEIVVDGFTIDVDVTGQVIYGRLSAPGVYDYYDDPIVLED